MFLLFLLGGTLVLGAFVLNPGQTVETAPKTQLEAAFWDDGTVAVTHEAGEVMDARTLTVRVGDEVAYDRGTLRPPFDGPDGQPWPGEVTAGDTLVLHDPAGDHDGESLQVVWHHPDSDATTTIFQRDWPS